MLSNKRTPEWFAAEISETWRGNVSSIFKVAVMLETAREELGRAEFAKMYRDHLKWSKQTISHLIKIAEDGRLAEVRHGVLPACWRTIYELTRLTNDEFQKGLDIGIIHAGMERKDIKELKPQKPKSEKSSGGAREPKTGDEWQSFLWTGLSKAAVSLEGQERADLFSVIRQHIDNLERKLNQKEAA